MCAAICNLAPRLGPQLPNRASFGMALRLFVFAKSLLQVGRFLKVLTQRRLQLQLELPNCVGKIPAPQDFSGFAAMIAATIGAEDIFVARARDAGRRLGNIVGEAKRKRKMWSGTQSFCDVLRRSFDLIA
jgi:hypothetical protein